MVLDTEKTIGPAITATNRIEIYTTTTNNIQPGIIIFKTIDKLLLLDGPSLLRFLFSGAGLFPQDRRNELGGGAVPSRRKEFKAVRGHFKCH